MDQYGKLSIVAANGLAVKGLLSWPGIDPDSLH
jgi:hypothetical protein